MYWKLFFFSAIINFNDGFYGLIDIFGALNLNPGYSTQRFCIERDEHEVLRDGIENDS